jgi:hypothetical protein
MNFYVGNLIGDFDGDRLINATDLALLAAHWGLDPAEIGDGDLNNNGVVDATDLAMLYSSYGTGLDPLTV